ncbi:hypothetical protein Trydic_g13847 [Trypoxylus dichotomus]
MPPILIGLTRVLLINKKDWEISINDESSFKDIEISIEKTESTVIGKEPIRCKLAANEKPNRQCMKRTYLGVEITSCQKHQEVIAQINKASRISGYLRGLIWRNKYISAETKTRADTTEAKNMMKAAEIKTLSAIKGVSLGHQIRSKVIREHFEIQDKVRFKGARRQFWWDHVDGITNS